MQGISPIQPLFANIRLEHICEFTYLRDNSFFIHHNPLKSHESAKGIVGNPWRKQPAFGNV
jgi:hypothetical protein